MQFVALNQLGFKLLHHLYLILVQVLEAELRWADGLLNVVDLIHRWREAASVEGRHRAHSWHAAVLLLVCVVLSLLLASLAIELVLALLVVVLHLIHLSHVV